jgi:FHS family glucose/mannose:H+ symporter-like MFS transporter
VANSAVKIDADSLGRRSPDAVGPSVVHAAKPWQILCGLAVSGLLLALPGGLLPLWGFHIQPDFGTAGNFFLVLGLGVIGGGALAQRLARVASLQRLLAGGYFAAALSLLVLAVAAPPAPSWYRFLALFVSGMAAGIMNTAVLEALSMRTTETGGGLCAGTPCYESNPATITLTGGIFFGAGSVLAALLLGRSFGDGGATRLLAVTAVIPAMAGIFAGLMHIDTRGSDVPAVPEVSLTDSIEDLHSPLAILFALLLFFQFANEWSLAGWLPVLLIDRLGLSPATAVTLLALYWGALMVGRIVAVRLLRVVRHGKLLGGSAFCALFGCTALLAAGSRFGVVVGLLLTGAGFSAIYPLVAERIAKRFSYYHPGYFNGIFTFALTGGILAPFVLGHLAGDAGLKVIPLAVMMGSCAVFGLVLLIWLGHKVSGH